MKISTLFICILLLSLSACFKVGRLPATTENGPEYTDAKSAIVVPKGGQTQILSVNNEAVKSDFLDRLANLALEPFLMYLEPQLFVRPGKNNLLVRAIESESTNYGSYTRKTTTWRDYTISLSAESGKKYYLIADLSSGVRVVPENLEPKNKDVKVALK